MINYPPGGFAAGAGLQSPSELGGLAPAYALVELTRINAYGDEAWLLFKRNGGVELALDMLKHEVRQAQGRVGLWLAEATCGCEATQDIMCGKCGVG